MSLCQHAQESKTEADLSSGRCQQTWFEPFHQLIGLKVPREVYPCLRRSPSCNACRRLRLCSGADVQPRINHSTSDIPINPRAAPPRENVPGGPSEVIHITVVFFWSPPGTSTTQPSNLYDSANGDGAFAASGRAGSSRKDGVSREA